MTPLALFLAASVIAQASGATETRGALCIAPFHREDAKPGQPPPDIGEPSMSPTTGPPAADSHFKFFIDGHLRATVGNHETAFITGLPTDRAIRVKVTLDEKPFESFRLTLGKEPDHRVCLWLYTGYWHWINTGWTAANGCACAADDKPKS